MSAAGSDDSNTPHATPEKPTTLNPPSMTPPHEQHHSPRSPTTPLDEHHLIKPYKSRVRTVSEAERIASTPAFRGMIESFCRQKGHGFIKPDDGSEHVFLHISDIEGEWCPKEGDLVSYKRILIPPKNQKYQAVHVHFIHLKDGVKHEHWDTPLPPH